MSRVWMGVGGFFKKLELARVGRSAFLFIGVPGVRLVVVVDIHNELEASHDGRVVSLKLEVRYQVSNTQPGWTASTNKEEVAVDMETNIKSGSGSGTGVHARLLQQTQTQTQTQMWERGLKAARQADRGRYEGYKAMAAPRGDRHARGRGHRGGEVGEARQETSGWDGMRNKPQAAAGDGECEVQYRYRERQATASVVSTARDRERKHSGVRAGPRQNVDCYIERWLSKGREKGTC